MTKHLVFALVLTLTAVFSRGLAAEPVSPLPTPHHHADPADPAWLLTAVQFHGHLGPWAAAGIRAGAAGRRAVDAQGYFDVDVTVEGPFVKPPHSCFLDGLQVSTGATLGKRNLHWVKADAIVVRFKNTETGKVAEVRLTDDLMKKLNPIGSPAKSDSAEPKTPAETRTESKASPTPKKEAGPKTSKTAGHRHDYRAESLARRIAAAREEDLFRVTTP